MPSREDFQIGWICALQIELEAAKLMLDEDFGPWEEQDSADNNVYPCGRIGLHFIVIACLPDGAPSVSVATVANDMIRTFSKSLRIGLMVGIGGGIPSLQHDIRLGDIVVSTPDGTCGGVIQYDMEKVGADGKFQRTGSLNSPPKAVLTAVDHMRAALLTNNTFYLPYIQQAIQKNTRVHKNFGRPDPQTDRLFQTNPDPSHFTTTDEKFLSENEVARDDRVEDHPVVHYGVIVSGNRVIEHRETRDRLYDETGALCFEMEAAGLMLDFPCIMIRGICDYTDSHKNKQWQRYAALAAAAYAKELLEYIPQGQVSQEKLAVDICKIVDIRHELEGKAYNQRESHHREHITRALTKVQQDCHQTFKTSTYELFKNINPDRVEGTCRWVLEDERYVRWLESDHNDLLWISADPGCGKSVLAKSLVESDLNQFIVCYFFFKDNDEQSNLATALCAILHQLFSMKPDLLRHALPSWKKNGNILQKETDELWHILMAATSDSVFGTICIFDGLDECQKDDRDRFIQKLEHFYTQSRSSHARGRLKFLVTSRPYNDIQVRFQKVTKLFPQIHLPGEDENDRIHKDIDLVVMKRMAELRENFALSPEVCQQLKQQLLQIEPRTHLWLHLAMENIRAEFRNSLRPEKESVSFIPHTLNEAYKNVLKRVPREQISATKAIFQVIIEARRPLTIGEIAMALEVRHRPFERITTKAGLDIGSLGGKIRSLYGLFVFINRSKIYFIHQTAREFLINEIAGSSNNKWAFELSETEKFMSRALSSDNQLKDTERDSGYGSASRPATSMTLSEPAFRYNIDSPITGRFETKQPYDTEIQSLTSDNDDIGSQASAQTTNEGMTGQALIRIFLAEEPQFRLLCEKAMAQMEIKRFVENLRRLLKSFHKNLSVEAETEAERAIARLMRSRRGRQRISQQLAVHIHQEKEEVLEVDRVDLGVAAEDKQLVELWLAHASSEAPVGFQGASCAPDQEFEDEVVDNRSSISDSDDGSERDEFPYISELKSFLRGANSFQVLLKDFMLMFLPIELRHVLSSIPKERIWVSQEQDFSVTNRVKAWIEDNTQVRWNWWPLESRKRMLRDGESRIFWKCTCGAQLWEEISTEQHDLVTKILSLTNGKPQSPYWCSRKGTGVSLRTWYKFMFWKVPSEPPATSTSVAAQKYTPLREAACASSLRRTSSPSNGGLFNGAVLAQPHQEEGPVAHQQDQIAAPDAADRTQSWVLFGVRGAQRTLTPTQIPIYIQTTDYSFFQELRKCYRIHRGRLRLWFSIWRLEYCEVVKFNRLTFGRMVREHKDLPSLQDYLYTPRAGAADARNPPISRHLFEALFYSCHFPCTWPIPHDCVPPPTGATTLERVPKRTKCFEGDQTSPIWGLEAVFAVSFAYVFIYHCVMVAGPFAFFWWWLIAHPDDLQNASVPVTVVLGFLSLFWSGAGILTSKISD